MDLSKTMSDGDFAKLRAVIHAQTGITIGETRKSLLVSRLRSRLRALDLASYTAYLERVAQDPAERRELTNRVTTNETYFYRTPRIWDYFNDVAVPEFAARVQNRALRVWSAAASTGEEAYTAGAFLEEMRSRTPGFDYSIVGTDISSRVLGIAETAIYKGRPVARFQKEQPEVFARRMVGSEAAGWSPAKEIKARVRFREHNLLRPLTNTAKFDIVFLRNVLIYFKAEDQATILRHVRAMMQPEGVLLIGESESLKHIDTDFEQIQPIIYRPVLRGGRVAS